MSFEPLAPQSDDASVTRCGHVAPNMAAPMGALWRRLLRSTAARGLCGTAAAEEPERAVWVRGGGGEVREGVPEWC